MSARPSPWLPTPLEAIILSVYPIILVIGTLFGTIDPSARKSTYSSLTQAHFANTAPSYFAKKNNIFNIFYVKKGWAWVTFSYFYFLFTHPATGPTTSFSMTPKRLHGLMRYGLMTLWWIFVTQWFFGPPIIDRSFTITGGQCELSGIKHAHAPPQNLDETRIFLTAVACKAEGGQWKGGHDISGHVFLLVLGSVFLIEEVLYVSLARQREERTVTMTDGAVKSADITSVTRFSKDATGIWTFGSKVAVGVTAMNLYMLLMTAAYFHTWFEKLTGLVMALFGVFVVYFMPRAVPALRSIVSMPGI